MSVNNYGEKCQVLLSILNEKHEGQRGIAFVAFGLVGWGIISLYTTVLSVIRSGR